MNFRVVERTGMSNLRPFMSKCYQNVSFYVTKSATDSDGMNVRIRTAFALEKAFAPLAQLAEQLTLNHACSEVKLPLLPNTLRIRFYPERAVIASLL